MASNSARLISHYRRTSSMCWPKVAPRTCVGKIAWGRGDVSLGRYPGHQSRLVAPPLSTGAALHARPWAEVVRASRPISPSQGKLPVGLAWASLRNGGGWDRYLTGKTPCTRRTPRRLAGAIACDDDGELRKAPIVAALGRGFSARSAALDARETICMTWAKGSFFRR